MSDYEEELIFEVASSFVADPLKARPVRLAKHRYETHIARKHSETFDRLHDIEYAIRSPHYVANCVSGPGNKHIAGLCFVRTDATPQASPSAIQAGTSITPKTVARTSYLHVMVQNDDIGPYIATALFADKYHGDIIWANPEAEAPEEEHEESQLDLSYDKEADILYLSKGEAVPAYSTAGADGLILRYAMDDERPCGVTVMSFHHWDEFHEQLAQHISAFLQIEPALAKRSLDYIAG
jgi:hypothetical protein